jgi:hypothetical protein
MSTSVSISGMTCPKCEYQGATEDFHVWLGSGLHSIYCPKCSTTFVVDTHDLRPSSAPRQSVMSRLKSFIINYFK